MTYTPILVRFKVDMSVPRQRSYHIVGIGGSPAAPGFLHIMYAGRGEGGSSLLRTYSIRYDRETGKPISMARNGIPINSHGLVSISFNMSPQPTVFTIVIERWDSQDDDADEARWDARFAATQDKLSRVAEKIRADIKARRTRPLDPDQM
ncbi:MAG TPA: hypothetical protein VLA19_29880 [Herpetosiphonaceae bacterium]|nr:hypothetical protein [Herpetosiphonaceae bacterium]